MWRPTVAHRVHTASGLTPWVYNEWILWYSDGTLSPVPLMPIFVEQLERLLLLDIAFKTQRITPVTSQAPEGPPSL